MKNKTALMLGYLCFSTICLVSVSMMRAELAFKTVFIFWFIISVLLLFYVLKLMGVIGKGNADGSGASETAAEGEIQVLHAEQASGLCQCHKGWSQLHGSGPVGG